MQGPPLLTVCICTHNRPRHLGDCLAALRGQSAPPDLFEVLVVDSASSAKSAVAVARLTGALRNGRLRRVDRPGLSLARNVGARAARAEHICYIDDDAVAAPDLVETVLRVLTATSPGPVLIGGRILPEWEAPLPNWWPASLRGVLSIVETEGTGEYRSAALPPGLQPCGTILVVHVGALLAAGGFDQASGRTGTLLLSDEEVQLAWRLQKAGHSVRYDSRIVVRHQIQAARLTPSWLLSRLHWQGISTVLTRRLLGQSGAVWQELPRRLLVVVLFAPAALVPRSCTRLIACRWRLAYAAGFIRGALGWYSIGSDRIKPTANTPVRGKNRTARRCDFHPAVRRSRA